MIGRSSGRRREVSVDPADAGLRLDRLLAAALPDLSRSRVKTLLEAGHVTAAGATVSDPAYRVKRGQTFAIVVPEPAPAIPVGQDITLDIVYEDTDLIVVNKPAGMAVHPGPGNPDRTLVNALIAHCGPSLSGIGGVHRPGIVHRLDKDTSGLMVAAKNDETHRALSAAFAERRVERAYRAVVWGLPPTTSGEISGNIARHRTDRKKMAVVARGGRPALTRYRVLRRLGEAASLVECRLGTGRTHQIRVHMASIGHPIVGDATYGRATAARQEHLRPAGRAAVKGLGRQALHAVLLGFEHPRTGRRLRWEAELPPDIRRLVDILEAV
jgi:23S rRNA pseudouridine1911/1915/1917 synthase